MYPPACCGRPVPGPGAAPFTFQLITMAADGTVVCMKGFDAAARLPRRPNGKLSLKGVRACVVSGEEIS
jgi:hypothetical protein